MLINYPSSRAPSIDGHDKLLKDMGGKAGNALSTPWPLPNTELTDENEFWAYRASHGFKAEIWGGQIKVGDEWANLMVYYCDVYQMQRGGFAVLVFRDHRKERVEYFRWIACKHHWISKTVGNCLNRYSCTVPGCGSVHEIDSSD